MKATANVSEGELPDQKWRSATENLLPQIIDHNNAINKRFEIDAMELKQLRNLYTDDQLKAMDILT